ncbi:MAG: hypothetical protein GX624_01005 [Actinobacteria bacterium]|nr:hypothetical protein [Actinomycetota bacterium]
MNITYTCPTCGTVQQAMASPGEGAEVPECSNPACTSEPAWGPVTLTMMKQAVVTVAQTHPQNTAAYTAGFILRLLGRVRKVPAVSDPESVDAWAAALDALARR